MFWLLIARVYAHLHRLVARTLHWYLPGLGFLCRRISLEHVIEIRGRRYFFYRPAASMYSYLIAGWFPEPETHVFFEKVFATLGQQPVSFIDIGAAVGEMIMDVARYPNVEKVYGFEPDPDLAQACRLSACINGFSKVEMRSKPMSDVAAPVNFNLQRGRGASGSMSDTTQTGEVLIAGTLDTEFPAALPSPILLIDVEGAELRVLKGGAAFIRAHRPMIIFEFNHVSQQFFSLDDVRKELGQEYSIWRLRSDGRLDQDFSQTWNCVAIHKDSVFAPASQKWVA